MYSALSLFLPVLFGMGWLVLHLNPVLVREPARTRQDAARLLSLSLMLGLLCNYAVVLIAGGLAVSFGIAAVMAAVGLFLAVRNKRTLAGVLGLGWLAWLTIAVLAVLYAALILFLPLNDWDARSIWLFHGKMIFYNGQAMNAAAGWDQPLAAFSHPGYPEMAPVLTAQFAALAGFWNEYFPKAGLLALLVPALIGLFSFIRKPGLSGVYLLAMALFLLGGMLWNGYVDGYLALYAGLACLFLGRWLTSNDQLDALSGIAALAVTASLKNEGDLLILTAAISLAALLLFQRRTLGPLKDLIAGRTWFITAAAFLGPLVWLVLKHRWHLPSEVPASPTDLQLISTRISQGAVSTIVVALLLTAEVAKAAGILACTLIAAWFVKKRIPAAAWFLALTAALYGSAMFWIYLTTNNDLAWHLGTSAARTMLPVIELLAAATFLCLYDMEEPGEDTTRPSKKKTRR